MCSQAGINGPATPLPAAPVPLVPLPVPRASPAARLADAQACAIATPAQSIAREGEGGGWGAEDDDLAEV